MNITDYKNRVYKKTNLKIGAIALIIITIVLGILAIFLILGDPNSFIFVVSFMIFLFLILMAGLWKQIYYLFIYRINDTDQIIRIEIEPYKISLKPYFDSGLFSKFGSSYLGVKIQYKLDNKKHQLIFPFLKEDVSLYPRNRYTVYQEIIGKLSQIENLTVAYLRSSKVIINSTTNIESIVTKVVKSNYK